ncbi:hypothetical protein A0H81_09509 [Grifola frondosa]|uniref:Uncharacterized protein n=1 Tax=Grifola frondosa TaxID=5627 RepID=A0A1C7M2K9_GRIFR|nr:hypothetical protein A0H81_09509 [Grifola frondosa]
MPKSNNGTNDTLHLATVLSEKYGKKPSHYLTLLFTSGMKMNNARKPNTFNAWTHHMAKELNEDGAGVSVNLLDLQRDNMEDYKNLSVEQKTVFIAELTEEREIWTTGQWPTQRGRTQDVNNVCLKIENLCLGLKHQTGVEFFYCLVCNTEDIPAYIKIKGRVVEGRNPGKNEQDAF